MGEMTDEDAAQLLSGSILSMSGTLDGKLRDAIIKALDALREKVGKKKETDFSLCTSGGPWHVVIGLASSPGWPFRCRDCGELLER